MKQVVQKVVGGGVIIKDGKVLIIQRAANETSFAGQWEVPSGKKEPLEDVKNAIVREVKEESGLNVELIAPCHTFVYKVEKEETIYDVTQVVYLVKTIDENPITISEEHDNFAWITKNQLNNYKISDETKESINNAFKLI